MIYVIVLLILIIIIQSLFLSIAFKEIEDLNKKVNILSDDSNNRSLSIGALEEHVDILYRSTKNSEISLNKLWTKTRGQNEKLAHKKESSKTKVTGNRKPSRAIPPLP